MTELQLDGATIGPDGTRPLALGRRLMSLQPSFLDPTDQPVTCFTAGSAAVERREPPEFCLRVIQPGRHYLLHTSQGLDGNLPLIERAYCAPCAIREWAFWHVHEVAP